MFAHWLDETLGDRRREVEEIIGYHLEQAFRYRAELAPVDAKGRELASSAAQALIAAGGRALERSDIAATVNLYGRAATLLEPTDPARLAILPDLGRALYDNGRWDEAKATLNEALQRAEADGDPRAIAYARVFHYLMLEPNVPASELRRIADECAAAFERADDERGLALAWRLRGEASWSEGNVAGDEGALASALEHARRAGSHWEEASIIQGFSIDLYWGPTPVADAIRWCDDVLAEAPSDRGIEMGVAHALGHMHARLGNFELARSYAARCIEIAAESGQRNEAIVLGKSRPMWKRLPETMKRPSGCSPKRATGSSRWVSRMPSSRRSTRSLRSTLDKQSTSSGSPAWSKDGPRQYGRCWMWRWRMLSEPRETCQRPSDTRAAPLLTSQLRTS